MLILGILAAIALPAFFNQKEKVGDAKAKEYVHSAQVAMEIWSTENSGSYAAPTEAARPLKGELERIEPTLANANILTLTGAAKEYKSKSKALLRLRSSGLKGEQPALRPSAVLQKVLADVRPLAIGRTADPACFGLPTTGFPASGCSDLTRPDEGWPRRSGLRQSTPGPSRNP
jgi:type II secretory pathway pseudopilin PulG